MPKISKYLRSTRLPVGGAVAVLFLLSVAGCGAHQDTRASEEARAAGSMSAQVAPSDEVQDQHDGTQVSKGVEESLRASLGAIAKDFEGDVEGAEARFSFCTTDFDYETRLTITKCSLISGDETEEHEGSEETESLP